MRPILNRGIRAGGILCAAALIAFCAAGAGAEVRQPYLVHPYAALEPGVAADTTSLRKEWYREHLEYEIYWGLVNVGSAYLRIDGIVTIDGRQAYHIVSGARSSAFIRNFYTVSDVNESWMDLLDLYSFGYYKDIHEGNFFANEWVVFDNKNGTFRGKKTTRAKTIAPVEGTLDGPVSDVLSSLYLVRTMELKPGTPLEFTVNTKKNWRMNVKVRRREKVSVPYGRFQCVVVEPQLGDDGLFVAKKGKKMLVWLTDDALRLPLILKAEIFIGSVTAKLVKRRLD